MRRFPRPGLEALLAVTVATALAGPAAGGEAPLALEPAALVEAPFAGASDAPPDAGDPGDAEERTQDEAVAYWQRRLSHAAKRVEVARDRVADADAEYSRARHDRDERGEALAAIKERRDAAHRELEAARASLPDLVERARRQGVPRGILQTYWDLLESWEQPAEG